MNCNKTYIDKHCANKTQNIQIEIVKAQVKWLYLTTNDSQMTEPNLTSSPRGAAQIKRPTAATKEKADLENESRGYLG